MKTGRKPAEAGQKFGLLTVLSCEYRHQTAPSRRGLQAWALCKCDCGKRHETTVNALRNGHIKSCGCIKGRFRLGRPFSHGGCINGNTEPLYTVWRGMIVRCSDKDHPSSKHYYHKGITVCRDWMDYGQFRAWAISAGYKTGLTIERKNSTEGYCPENCEWITRGENGRRANAQRKAREDWMVREILWLTAEVKRLAKLLEAAYGH